MREQAPRNSNQEYLHTPPVITRDNSVVQFRYPHGQLRADMSADEQLFNLTSVAVEADYRGRGIGTALLNYAKQYAEKQSRARIIMGQMVTPSSVSIAKKIFPERSIWLPEEAATSAVVEHNIRRRSPRLASIIHFRRP